MKLSLLLIPLLLAAHYRVSSAEIKNIFSLFRSPSPLHVYATVFKSLLSDEPSKRNLAERIFWGKRHTKFHQAARIKYFPLCSLKCRNILERARVLGWGNDLLVGKRQVSEEREGHEEEIPRELAEIWDQEETNPGGVKRSVPASGSLEMLPGYLKRFYSHVPLYELQATNPLKYWNINPLGKRMYNSKEDLESQKERIRLFCLKGRIIRRLLCEKKLLTKGSIDLKQFCSSGWPEECGGPVTVLKKLAGGIGGGAAGKVPAKYRKIFVRI